MSSANTVLGPIRRSITIVNSATDSTISSGLQKRGDTVVYVPYAIGTSGQAPNASYPGGNYGLGVVACDLLLVSKATGAGADFTQGDKVFHDADVPTQVVNDTGAVSGDLICGVAAESVATDASQVKVIFDGANYNAKA